MMIKAFSKKLFGVKYEKVMRTLIIVAAVFGGLYFSGYHLAVSTFVICLMTTALTVGEMWHALVSDDNAANMKQIFMMPVDSKEFIFSYIGCLGGYVFLTRTLLILAVLFAVAGVDARIVGLAVLVVVCATMLAAGIYVWKKMRVLTIAWLAGIIAAFWFFKDSWIIWAVLGASIVLEIVLLMNTDVYAFYREESSKKNVIRGGKNSSVWVYFFRYIGAHKNYIVNSLFIWGLAVLFPIFMKEMVEQNSQLGSYIIPIGFAILTLNTPICILLSCDPALEQAVRYLPGQKSAFFIPYALFIFVCNMIAQGIYLVSLHFQIGGVSVMHIVIAVCFALVSAILSVLLECYFPIRGWKIENELWNHPRKYVVPGIMVIIAGLVGMVL